MDAPQASSKATVAPAAAIAPAAAAAPAVAATPAGAITPRIPVVDYPKFTLQEKGFAETLFRYLPQGLDIDWEGFAKDMAFKNGTVAKVRITHPRL